MEPVYLDYNATTPLEPAVLEAMRPYLGTDFGNPSSSHVYGLRAREAVERARAQVAEALGAKPREIVFTSGGTESNNLAIRGVACRSGAPGGHIVTSAIEHPAVMEVCRRLEREGCGLTVIPVDSFGSVDPGEVERAITPRTTLVTVMHANNEVGTVEPIRELAQVARARGALLHTDAAQSVGKLDVRVADLGVDLLSLAGHKLYAPKGVGALYVREGVDLAPLLVGAGQETGRRPGTENVAGIVGLGAACELVARALRHRAEQMRRMRDRLQDGIVARVDGVVLNGHPTARLPNTVSLGFRGIEARRLLAAMPEVAASPGAACHSGETVASATLSAMGVDLEIARATIRFSTGTLLSDEGIDRAIEAVAAAVRRARGGTT